VNRALGHHHTLAGTHLQSHIGLEAELAPFWPAVINASFYATVYMKDGVALRSHYIPPTKRSTVA